MNSLAYMDFAHVAFKGCYPQLGNEVSNLYGLYLYGA